MAQLLPAKSELYMSRKPRVLVVEDDQLTQKFLTTILDGLGASTTLCHNGATGLYELIRNPDWDAVVLDLMMPEVTGIELLRVAEHLHAIGTLQIRSKIIVHTAVADFEELRGLMTLETVHCVMQKPISRSDLIKRLCEIIEPAEHPHHLLENSRL